ncbi:MAG: MFS transporter [Cellvibrionaceae bacterium]
MSATRSTTFVALTNSNYRWLFAGNLAMFFSIASRMMLTNLLAWDLTKDETSLAFINFALAIPMFIGALIAGAIVDRLERRKLILFGLIIVLIGESSVLIALLFNHLTYTHLLIATFLGGSAHPFVMPASTTVMFGLLGKSQMANGVALMSGAMNLSRILGPVITGIVAAFAGADIAFAIVVSLSFIALCCQWQLPQSFPVLGKAVSITEDILIGFRYLFQSRTILLCLLYGLIPILLAMSVQYFLVVLADKIWMAGANGLGILLAAMGTGGIVGSLIVARVGERYSRSKMMLISSVCCAFFFGLFGASDSFWLAVVLLGVANMFTIISQVVNQVSIQLLVDENVRGRVSGYVLMSFSLGPFAVIPLAYFIQLIGPKLAIISAASLTIVLSIIFYWASSKIRNIDHLISAEIVVTDKPVLKG